jgi:hypothetical protein
MLQNRLVSLHDPQEKEDLITAVAGVGEDAAGEVTDVVFDRQQQGADREAHAIRVAKAKETCRQRRICTFILLGVYILIVLYFWKKHRKNS